MHCRQTVIPVLLLAGTLAGAEAFAQEPLVDRSAEDARLKWGPCPSFMPQGCEIAVLHGDPAKPNADVFFQVPANFDIPRHWHTSAERMVLVAGEMQVTYDGQEPVTLSPGHYAYGPARLPHSGTCGQAGSCILFIAFESPVDAVASDDARK